MKFPLLETERLVLRGLKHRDAEALLDYFSNDEVTKFYDIDSLSNIQQAHAILTNWEGKFGQLEGIRWGICLKGKQEIIGTCGYHKWLPRHSKAEIGYELAPQYWSQGYMSEAVSAIIAYGFEEMNLNRIEAMIHCDNDASRKLLESKGFMQEGILRQYMYMKQHFADVVIFSLLKHEQQKQA